MNLCITHACPQIFQTQNPTLTPARGMHEELHVRQRVGRAEQHEQLQRRGELVRPTVSHNPERGAVQVLQNGHKALSQHPAKRTDGWITEMGQSTCSSGCGVHSNGFMKCSMLTKLQVMLANKPATTCAHTVHLP